MIYTFNSVFQEISALPEKRSLRFKKPLSNTQSESLRWLQERATWEELDLGIPTAFYRTDVPAKYAAHMDSLLDLLVEERFLSSRKPIPFDVKHSKRISLSGRELKALGIQLPMEKCPTSRQRT